MRLIALSVLLFTGACSDDEPTRSEPPPACECSDPSFVCDVRGSCVAPCTDDNECGNCAECRTGGRCVAITPCRCNDASDCDDGVVCNGVEVCSGGVCGAGVEITCPPAASSCFDNVCDEASGGCTLVGNQSCPCANDGECGDGDPCNGIEICPAGFCEPGAPHTCPDPGQVCRIARCIDQSGVAACETVAAPIDTPCDDGLPCTDAYCDAVGDCTGNGCDDHVDCTEDACNTITDECEATPNDALCADDGVTCTIAACDAVDGCQQQADDALCDDGNPCTIDTCDPATGDVTTGCAHQDIDTGPCDIGNPCAVSAECQAGQCVVSVAGPDFIPCGGTGMCRDGDCWLQARHEASGSCEATNVSYVIGATVYHGTVDVGVETNDHCGAGVLQGAAIFSVTGRSDLTQIGEASYVYGSDFSGPFYVGRTRGSSSDPVLGIREGDSYVFTGHDLHTAVDTTGIDRIVRARVVPACVVSGCLVGSVEYYFFLGRDDEVRRCTHSRSCVSFPCMHSYACDATPVFEDPLRDVNFFEGATDSPDGYPVYDGFIVNAVSNGDPPYTLFGDHDLDGVADAEVFNPEFWMSGSVSINGSQALFYNDASWTLCSAPPLWTCTTYSAPAVFEQPTTAHIERMPTGELVWVNVSSTDPAVSILPFGETPLLANRWYTLELLPGGTPGFGVLTEDAVYVFGSNGRFLVIWSFLPPGS